MLVAGTNCYPAFFSSILLKWPMVGLGLVNKLMHYPSECCAIRITLVIAALQWIRTSEIISAADVSLIFLMMILMIDATCSCHSGGHAVAIGCHLCHL